MSDATCRSRGGWITFPFISGSAALVALAGNGWMANLMVYLIEEFNVKSVAAAQTWTAFTGSTSLLPILGAITADSYAGCFTVISASSLISLMGLILITLTAILDKLRPQKCNLNFCPNPSRYQSAVLYTGLALAALGSAGTRFTSLTMGADQFDKPEDRLRFFSWSFVAQYTASVIGATILVYVQDNVSWGLGFGLCACTNAVGLGIFLTGKGLYRPEDRPRGSPFVDLARVVVAAVRKRKAQLTFNSEDYYHGPDGQVTGRTCSKKFRFLNRAALKTEGDVAPSGSVLRPWRLCTLQQVEDLKTLLGILPLWSTGILLSTTIVTQGSLVVLQALAMDRHLGRYFKIPAGSMWVVSMISLSTFLTLRERVLDLVWQKMTSRSPTALQRIGAGHVLNVLSLVAASVVETKRLSSTRHLEKLSSLWLFPQLILVGLGLSLHHPGQAEFYYQEFPALLRSTATAMASVTIGIGYYLSTVFLDMCRRVTKWLPDNINSGMVDNVYWTLVVVGALNFLYYLICVGRYKYRIRDPESEGVPESTGNSGSEK